MRLLVAAALLATATAAPAQQLPAKSDADALHLLDLVAKHYQDADTLHLEATVHRTSHNDLYDESETSTLSATVAPGDRFRYEGTDFIGSGLIVSDGTSEWRLLRSFAEYAKEPAGTYFAGTYMVGGDDRTVIDARSLISNLNFLGAGLTSAHFAPKESIVINGHKVRCTVVQYGSDDFSPPRGRKTETILWIDAASLTLFKQQTRSQDKLMYGTKTPPHGPETEHTDTTTYTKTEFNFEPKPDAFTFVPPEGTKEVAELPDPYPKGMKSVFTQQRSAAEKLSARFVGKPLPPIVLQDIDGHDVPLSRYRGHPLLLDFWATWCGGCLNELPALARLRRSTSQTDFKIIGIDEDFTRSIGPDFLKRKGYDWDDFHFNRSITSQLSVGGIPLIVLVDANGIIVYDQVGTEDPSGLLHAITKLGPAYAGATVDR